MPENKNTGRKGNCGNNGRFANGTVSKGNSKNILYKGGDFMQNTNNKKINTPEQAEPSRLMKKIGSTIYEVNIYFSKTSKETLNDKIIKLIEREAKYNA
ncbi:MAG: transposon-encoded TnpW family protein [Oscillospiraceae bacterium]|nr:transposon-encoded TnpW family protein [Oscillospiraceae bacterium]